MHIIRTAFWLSAVIMFLPASNDNDPNSGKPQKVSYVQTSDMISAASAAADDLGSFCVRQPGVCETGSQAFQLFKAKARTGVRMLYDLTQDGDAPVTVDLDQKADHITTASIGNRDMKALVRRIQTGSANGKLAGNSGEASKSTLTIEDLIPAWTEPRKS